MKTVVSFSILVLGLIFLTACDSKVKNQDEKSAELSTETVDTIVIEGMQFKPEKLNVSKGTKVVWINKDFVVHDVTAEKDAKQTSGDIEVGKTFEMTIDQDFNYKCSIHPTMKAEILIKK